MPASGSTEFWDPTFTYEHRDDGTILMRQEGDLPDHLPTLADYLDKWAEAAPDRPWLARRVDGGDWRYIPYGRARQTARAIGASLINLGLGPDRPLLILSENSLEHALLGAACFYVGIPYAPVSPAFSLVSRDHKKLKDIAALLKPGAIFADDGAAFADAMASIASDGCHQINLRNRVTDAISFDVLMETAPDGAVSARAAVKPATVVKYLFTSGSTGSPKAVINTNEMICSMEAMVGDCYRFLSKSPPVVLDWMPWNHTAAGNKTSYLVLTNGGTYYIDDGRPTAGKFDETVRNLREIACSWYFNVPAGWDMLVDALEEEPELARTFFRKLDMMFYAGAGMAQHTWDRLSALSRAYRGHDILLATGLGATETAPFALACTEIQKRSGNVGVPCKGLTLKLVPIDDKQEIRLRGPSITPGYFGDPKRTAEAFDDEGFYKMGDALRPADPGDFSKGFFFDGRITENFKLATGTWVAVGSVRTRIVDAMDGLIKDAVVVGENRPELGAFLILSERAAALDAANRDLEIRQRLEAAAKVATGSSSRVMRAVIFEGEISFDRGKITEKGSLNQRAMRANNSALIDQLYDGAEGSILI